MTRGRPPSSHRRIKCHISLSEAVITKIDVMLFDPLSMRPKYGSRSELIEQLLINKLNDLELAKRKGSK